MKIYSVLISLSVATAFLVSCKSSSTVAYYNYETTCMGDGMDGSVVVRVNGSGANNSAAIREAKKKAVYDVMFNGLRKGQCNYRPLVLEANAREKHKEYFNKFFSNRGDFNDFISLDVTKMGSEEVYKSKVNNSYYLVLRVLRFDLERKLIEDNIIKESL